MRRETMRRAGRTAHTEPSRTGRPHMKSRLPKWACAAFGLIVAVGFLPALASAQGRVKSGTATQVPPDGNQSGRGQVTITGTFGCDSDLALNTCFLFLDKILFEAGELVQAEGCLFDEIGDPLAIAAKSGSKAKDAIFEVNHRREPRCKMQVKNRGKGVCEFKLKVDRVVVDTPSDSPVSLETAFELDCAGSSAAFDVSACWRSSINGPGNWRAPRPDTECE